MTLAPPSSWQALRRGLLAAGLCVGALSLGEHLLTTNQTELRAAGPAGTSWQGLELRGVDVWSRGMVSRQFLELRCARWPLLRRRSSFWAGPEWRGSVVWGAEAVTYRPAFRGVHPLSLSRPAWARGCRVSR